MPIQQLSSTWGEGKSDKIKLEQSWREGQDNLINLKGEQEIVLG